MDLREYVFRKRTTYDELCKKVGCSRNHLNRVGTGTLKPSVCLAKVIEMVTNGEVTADELLNPVKEENI